MNILFLFDADMVCFNVWEIDCTDLFGPIHMVFTTTGMIYTFVIKHIEYMERVSKSIIMTLLNRRSSPAFQNTKQSL